MYDMLFNEELQKDMLKFFSEDLSKLGTIRDVKKNEIIDPETADQVYIVLSGSFKQALYSAEGDEITFFRLRSGTIFGEMDYFDGMRTCVITKAVENSKVSVLSRQVLEKELKNDPLIYRQFMHSVIRKYRIVMLELADVKFNDSLGKLAHSIIRLAYTTKHHAKGDAGVQKVHIAITHDELASRTASNRSTVTNGLKTFKDKGLIAIKDRQIIILNLDGLKSYVTHYWDE